MESYVTCYRCQWTGKVWVWDWTQSKYSDPYSNTNQVLCQKCLWKWKIQKEKKDDDGLTIIKGKK